MAVAALLCGALAACTSTTLGTPTPTPIVAIEKTPTPAASHGAPSPPATGGDCLAQASGEALVGQPCIEGTDETVHDVTDRQMDNITVHTVAPMKVTFSLWAVAPGTLKGTAHLTYSLTATVIDTTRAPSCPVQTEKVDPLTWDVELDGQYFTQPDGSILVNVLARPKQGPGYTERFEDCPIPDRAAPGIVFSALSGTLIRGVSDVRSDLPMPPKTTGQSYVTTHMEKVGRP
jgi:hypothetical protein